MAEVMVDEDGFEKVPRELVEASVEYQSGNSSVSSQLGVPPMIQEIYNYLRNDVLPQQSVLEVCVRIAH